MVTYEMKAGREFLIRMPKGEDIIAVIEKFCEEKDIRSAAVWGIGAVERAVLGFYDAKSGQYLSIPRDEQMEVVHCAGNVSRKEWKVHVHLHVILADREGRCFGGHLLPGSVIFAGEFYISEFKNEPPERVHDPETDLFLWKKRE
ncbi:MAG: DNA-binding protein [Candidatus Eremiobacteraeota bacterium]|nr:DNA-binding protein [Candidatus Eremiobacteraeota bacterium]